MSTATAYWREKGSVSVFCFLLAAHDHVWLTKEVALIPRVEACLLIWQAALKVRPGTEMKWEE